MSTDTATVARLGRIRSIAGRAATIDSGDIAQTRGATRMRRALSLLFFGYALVLCVETVSRAGIPSAATLAMMMLALAMFANRGGRFIRDWLPVMLGFLAYGLAGQFAEQFRLDVHFMPQIDADRIIGLGTVPTTWLQSHLYSGTTGPLEVFTTLMYFSHFFVPPLLGFYIWWRCGRPAFHALMYGLLTVALLGEVTFILAPTAPPWMAAEHGLIPQVHHIVKGTLTHFHITAAAAIKDEPGSYNLVAALPSLHIAFPVVSLLAARRFRLPRWVVSAQAFVLAGMLFAIVYGGEHYVIDALVGAVYAVVAWRLVLKLLGHPTVEPRPSAAPPDIPDRGPVPEPAAP